MAEPLVSVVLPVKNGAMFLRSAIGSVLAQTHRNFELLVIDNASNDDTREIVATFANPGGANHDPRVRLIEVGDVGLVAALNHGLAQADGAYVARMDADDLSDPRRFERQVAFFADNPSCVLLGTGYYLIDETGSVIGRRRVPTTHELIRAETCFGNPIGHPTVMFAVDRMSSELQYVGDYPDAEDFELWLRLLETGTVANLPDPLVSYRVHESSVTNLDVHRNRRSAIEAHRRNARSNTEADLYELTYNAPDAVDSWSHLRGIAGLNLHNLRHGRYQRRALARRSAAAIRRTLHRSIAWRFEASTPQPHTTSETTDVERPRSDSMSIEVCLLTRGDRPEACARAIESAHNHGFDRVRVLMNGVSDPAVAHSAHEPVVVITDAESECFGNPGEVVPGGTGSGNVVVEYSSENLGIPGGRNRLAQSSDADILFFLDDDAEVVSMSPEAVTALFEQDPKLAVVSCRIIDEQGQTARYFVPVAGAADPGRSRPSATFLGGASCIRREAMERVGGYWSELFYSHEETDLSWRLYDDGYTIEYDAQLELFHPRGEIDRHRRGWELTGRNRVLIARRDLPWPIALVHVTTWLVLGLWRAPSAATKKAYLGGWLNGWRIQVPRRPIAWATVWRLGQVGRLPVT